MQVGILGVLRWRGASFTFLITINTSVGASISVIGRSGAMAELTSDVVDGFAHLVHLKQVLDMVLDKKLSKGDGFLSASEGEVDTFLGVHFFSNLDSDNTRFVDNFLDSLSAFADNLANKLRGDGNRGNNEFKKTTGLFGGVFSFSINLKAKV